VRSVSSGKPGRQPMTDKREQYVRLIGQGMSNSAACRSLGIDRKTGHWWKNGGVVVRNGVTRIVKPVEAQVAPKPESGRYLGEDERVTIADAVRAGRSARAIAADLGRAVSTVARELARNAASDGNYRPHAAQAKMLARRPRPRPRRLKVDGELRQVVQGYLDQRWSPEWVCQPVFGPSLAFCFGPSCGWGEWRSVGLGWGAVGGGFPAVVLPGAGAGDAEEIADFGPGAFLVASVGDRGGE
jgi:transposase